MEFVKPVKGILSGTNLNYIEISVEVQNILENEEMSSTFYLISNKLPVFVGSNWIPIRERILRQDGNVKLALFNKPQLPNFIRKDSSLDRKIEIYQLDEPVNRLQGLFYGTKYVFSNDGENFRLVNQVYKKESFEEFFSKAAEKLKRIEISDCFE